MKRAEYEAASARLWEKVQKRFPLGAPVRMSAEGVNRFPNYKQRTGKVVGYYKKCSPKVLFEGRKTADSWHPDFLEVIHS